MKVKILLVTLLFLFLIIALTTSVNAKITNLHFNDNIITIYLNSYAYVSVGYQTDDVLNDPDTVVYSSGDNSIVTIESDGKRSCKVTGKNVGETTIKAKIGDEIAICKVKVVYKSIEIGSNSSKYASNVNLVLNEHDSENLYAIVQDGQFENVKDALVNWKSSDKSIVEVDENSGKINALKPGKVSITAEAEGVTDTCTVTVYNGPEFTDLKNAKYEMNTDILSNKLAIRGADIKNNSGYYYIITSSNKKPEISYSSYGDIDLEKTNEEVNSLLSNAKEKYLYTYDLSKYIELNQDLYLWVLQTIRLEESYYNSDGNLVLYSTKFILEGQKFNRAPLPQLNLILQFFNIGSWTSVSTDEKDNYTSINFNFPSKTENRKFTLKIGKVTDNSILNKIKNNDYTGITDLLEYAKNNKAIYSSKLTTTSITYFRSDKALFDGRKLLEKDAYYFIYAKFDDENGKYYPIEGVTLGQAYLSEKSSNWWINAYTSTDFKWDNLTYAPVVDDENETKKEDKTTEDTKKNETKQTNTIKNETKQTNTVKNETKQTNTIKNETKQTVNKQTNTNKNETKQTVNKQTNTNKNESKKNNQIVLPYAGNGSAFIIAFFVVLVIGIIAYINLKKTKDI